MKSFSYQDEIIEDLESLETRLVAAVKVIRSARCAAKKGDAAGTYNALATNDGKDADINTREALRIILGKLPS